MAVELCTDSSTSSRGISPRISFSYDLNQSDLVPTEPHIPLSQSLLDIEFDFCVSRRSHDQDSFLADELFANGFILPVQIKRKNLPMKSKSPSSSFSSLRPPLAPQPPPPCGAHRAETESQRETEEKQGSSNSSSSSSKLSFWRFKRSKSYNCGSIYGRGLCPLPLLSRSKSTGSTTSAKRSLISKDEGHHNHHQSHQNNGGFKQNSQKNLNSSYYQKPPLKKSYGSSFNSGVVLNVPTGKLLGFGSIFSSGKDKGKKK